MTVSIADAQARLPELIAALKPGEAVVITADDRPVARLVAEEPPKREPRKSGTLKGTVLYMAPDFDAPLDDFKEYME
jgi:antitoxin (DNA-binding transcriptional repressor) of toxin-antitoxin stability system